MTTFPSAFLSDLSSHTDNILIHRDWTGAGVCVLCLVWVKKRKEGKSCEERGVVTETVVGVIKAPDHQTYTQAVQTYTQAVHGVTNRSVLERR